MSKEKGQGMLLGKQAPAVDGYAPELLYPLSRADGRARIATAGAHPFMGADLWHAYEMSWLDAAAKPVTFVGRFTIPASSSNMVESKSLKLYLNSLNNTRFESVELVRELIRRDVSQVVGADVELQVLALDDESLAGTQLTGSCLDQLDAGVPEHHPAADILKIQDTAHTEEKLYTHLLRSLCPVTGQPDWASVWVHYKGAALVRESLLRYIISYRNHQEFHEQCVERMFSDLCARIAPEFLHIQAFYTRRGGLDINPFRSTDQAARPLPRLNRQ